MHERLSDLMNTITRWAGDTRAFVGFWVVVMLWLSLGPLLGFSEAWQLAINTPTTIITTAMTFAILHVENRGDKAIQAKLDDIIASMSDVDNRALGLENEQEEDIDEIHETIVQEADEER